MKKFFLCWKCVWSSLSKIHLVDKCLLLFMTILLFQSAYYLFAGGTPTSEIGSIDLIFRTSSAAIFGYFLSANFIRHPNLPADNHTAGSKTITSPSDDPSKTKNKMGFAPPDASPEENPPGNIEFLKEPEEEDMISRLQIIIATAIGLFCLLVLIGLRDLSQFAPDMSGSSSSIATISQFRDYVSGCVGFLIGCPTNRADGSNS